MKTETQEKIRGIATVLITCFILWVTVSLAFEWKYQQQHNLIRMESSK